MKLRDCIVKAAVYLGLKDYAMSVEFSLDDIIETREFSALARNVIKEICTDYYPMTKKEVITVKSDGIFMFKDLTEPPIDIFKLTKNGISYPFVIKYNRFETKQTGECEVEYSVMPKFTTIDAEFDFPQRIDACIIGYGMAAEYCIINGLDDAIVWDKRFKDALKKAIKPKTEKRIKKRKWL